MKVKINKVVPISQERFLKYKGEPIEIDGEKYAPSPLKIQENYTGYPIYLQLICTLPDSEYQYLKIEARAENIDYKKVLEKKSQTTKNIKKGSCKKNFLFSFIPQFKGNYKVFMQSSYKAKNYIQSSVPPQQKREVFQIQLKCDQPFEVTQKIISQDKSGSISFPLFIQYSIQCKISDRQLNFLISFTSQKFNYNFLNSENRFKLNKDQVFYVVLELQPRVVKELLHEKGITLGILKCNYGHQGSFQKKTCLKQTDKYIFFKGQSLTKVISKKDIAILKLRFSKIYNLNFTLNNLRLVIDEKELSGIKIIKTSKQVVNLDQKPYEDVEISVICLRSGYFHLKGISLQTSDSRTVNYCNDLTFSVANQEEIKHEVVFERTTSIDVDLI